MPFVIIPEESFFETITLLFYFTIKVLERQEISSP